MTRLTSAASTSMPYGDAYAITCEVSATTGTSLVRNRFVKLDTAGTCGTGKHPIIYPSAGANGKTIFGLVGGYRVQAPITNAGTVHTGTAADPYLPGDNVAVTIKGSDLVEAAVAAGGEGALACGDLIMTDAAGKAVKWVAGTVSPSMTATIGNVDLGAIIAAATATIGDAAIGTTISGATATLTADHPTAVEIKALLTEVMVEYNASEAIKTKAWLEEVIEAYAAAEAVKNTAFITEYVGDYAAGGGGGYGSVIGVALGIPDADKLVSFLFIGRA